ncbi:threonyl-tRNA synthetase [Spirochaeta thermophila DSM 6578]|uniref:Threonine--tRNA ligase n=1 Tax=Winmispira thermophila (strain ATCC 700085 / DSM 6578 / Z-1203) TaxID=869211 RepID=G0GBB4_WINT7|nr:threonine--tRNA ligase [Spirochaeta thermophila]AEJ61923.1 threonyl-tRNA synthetase [Spirochaeta thermophila DSM 6578]
MGAPDIERIRHSAAHIMADAVLRLFPEAKFAIGPAIDTGFYYDFDLPRSLTPEDLEKIEELMRKTIEEDLPFKREVISREEARELFKDQPYKLEILEEIPEGEEVSIYRHGTFVDLCRGPHVERTGQINPDAVKLLSIAGAYWRGDERRPMLQRIYGTAWHTPKELRQYLEHLKEVEKRDHRRLGKELDLFSVHEEAGPGLIYWHPKGARIRLEIENFWREQHLARGYEVLYTPHIGKAWLWETSGHLSFYKENMYAPMEVDKSDYYIKPMNCPFHIMIYKTRLRSYRELPLRWAELGTVYRYERSGVLHGLLRVRGFTQDDAHIFCTPEQIEDEILETLRFSLFMWKTFGFSDVKAYLSTRPDKSVGEPERWEQATESLRKAIEREGLDYEVDEGGGAFYGPKIDIKVRDALGREWQTSTIQFDFNLPERFDITYVDADGREKRPYMVHRALLGSLERFFGILVEHYGGAFPVWLAPVQVVVIPVSDVFAGYAQEVVRALREAGVRAEADLSADRMNAKIRKAQQEKIPYAVIVGQREQEGRTVSVRVRGGEQRNGVALGDFVEDVARRVHERSLEL